MPELPEVEVLVRHLVPQLIGKRIQRVEVLRKRVIRPSHVDELSKQLVGRKVAGVSRRAKYLIFAFDGVEGAEPVQILGHLGMTGRMYLLPKSAALPKHAAVTLDLGGEKFVFEDPRGFGRFTLDSSGLENLGPEPLGAEFTEGYLAKALKSSGQAIKVKLMDQTLVAGIGNIYASEALFKAGISPRRKARTLKRAEIGQLVKSIREVLEQSIQFGSTISLNWSAAPKTDGLFYYGSEPESPPGAEERFAVYDRAGAKCSLCGAGIKRMVQAQRSTFYCPKCQR